MTYVGRDDQQLQIHGARVELGAIEAMLRDEAEVDLAIAVGWPVTKAGADGIVAFVLRSSVDQSEIKSRLRKCLPVFMVPRKVFVLTKFPRNANGKVDRKALMKMLEEGQFDSATT